MPTYEYTCGTCHNNFEHFAYFSQYNGQGQCPVCKCISRKRVYAIPLVFVRAATSEIKTLGHLADRRRDELSADEKIGLKIKHNSYRHNKPQKELPRGMTRIDKNLSNLVLPDREDRRTKRPKNDPKK